MWLSPVTRYTLGVSAMFSFYWLCRRFVILPLQDKRKLSKDSKQLIHTALLYLPGLGLLLLLTKDLPSYPVSSQGFATTDYAVVFAAQFLAIVIMTLFSILEIKLGLVSPRALADNEEDNRILNVILLLTVIPLMEELICRKLPGDLLGNGQIRLFLCLSALVFSLLHLQTGRIAVAVGMFYTGSLWALVYAGSGSLLLCTTFHILFNLIMVFVPGLLKKKVSGKAEAIYHTGLALTGTIGFLLLAFNFAHYLPPASSGIESPWRHIFSNWGFWVLAAICILSYFRARKALKAKGASLEKQSGNGIDNTKQNLKIN
jgi:membrane protease YdiL (CAAX protease family)